MPASLVAATFRSGLRLDPFRWARLGFARSHDWVCSGGLNRAYEAQVRVYAKLTATLRFREHEPAFGTRIATGLKLSGCADESCLGNRSHNKRVPLCERFRLHKSFAQPWGPSCERFPIAKSFAQRGFSGETALDLSCANDSRRTFRSHNDAIPLCERFAGCGPAFGAQIATGRESPPYASDSC